MTQFYVCLCVYRWACDNPKINWSDSDFNMASLTSVKKVPIFIKKHNRYSHIPVKQNTYKQYLDFKQV